MKIVQVEEVELRRGLEHRGGTFHARTMVEGTPGTPGNFKFSLSELGTDYSGPRHRHNFDQLRFLLDGEMDYRDGVLKKGMLGYFPEGVYYGPQVNRTAIKVAIVQFGGASGSGYILPRDIKRGMEELKASGTFEDGIYRRNDGEPGKRNLDAYQAIWEHINKRPMVYPEPRYDAPIAMDTSRFDWVPVKGSRGVFEKLLGVWTERRIEAGMLKLDPGARHSVTGRGLHLVLSGTGACEDKPLKQHTTLFLDSGENAIIEAERTLDLLHYGLPDFSDLASRTSALSMQAAE